MPPNPVQIRKRSFATLLVRCLSLEEGDSLLVIYDESFDPYCEALIETVCDLRILTTLIQIPKRYQEHLLKNADPENGDIELPAPLCSAVGGAKAILNVLSGDFQTVKVRGAVVNLINLASGGGCRLAHVPGISDQILEILAQTPMDKIQVWCEKVAWAMGEAESATIITRDRSGAVHELIVPLGSWDNEPHMSTGVIPADSWGNVPPAETFCCPPAYQAQGSICINGSVKGHVLAAGEEIVLTFCEGRLINWDGEPDSGSYQFFERERDRADASGDSEWNVLAELGVGLNPAVRELTGNPLMDEKAAKTIHIAIGDNFHFGGSVKAKIHADLVTWRPDVKFDRRPIMKNGKICFDMIDDWRNALSVQEGLPSFDRIALRVAKANFRTDGRLWRGLTRANRHGSIQFVNDELSYALTGLCSELVTYGESVDLKQFRAEHPHFRGHPTDQLLSILYHFRIVGSAGNRT